MSRHLIIEGLDGSGKDTVLDHLQEYLEDSGRKVLRTKTPSFNPVGSLLTNHYFGKAKTLFPDPEQRALFMGALFAADMLEHDREVRMFKQDDGDRSWILQSRTWISTWSYQSASFTVQGMLDDGIVPALSPPDAIVFMYADIDVCLERIHGRKEKAVVDLYEHRDGLRTVYNQMTGIIGELQEGSSCSPWALAKILELDTTELALADPFARVLGFLREEHLIDVGS